MSGYQFYSALLMAVQILKKWYICSFPAFPNKPRTEALSSATWDPIYMSYDPSYLIRFLCRWTKEAWSICAHIQISCLWDKEGRSYAVSISATWTSYKVTYVNTIGRTIATLSFSCGIRLDDIVNFDKIQSNHLISRSRGESYSVHV